MSQIRFLNLDDGWAFGPQLWAPHDGGQTWAQVGTHGQRVTDLETVGDRVFAVFADLHGPRGAGLAGGTSSLFPASFPPFWAGHATQVLRR